MQSKFSTLITVLLLSASLFTACKKGQDVAAPTPPPAPTPIPTPVSTVSDPEKIKDSALLFTRELYLWHSQIPATFDARSFNDPEAIMKAIRQYSNEPGFGAPVDRWSFAMKKKDWDNLSAGLNANFSASSAQEGDFGFGVFFISEGDLRVKYVERESPAGKAGIRRGWRVSKINGSTGISTSNTSFVVTNVFESAQTSFTFMKPDGSSVDITLTAGKYKEHPVYFDSVYNISSKKIGYMVFKSFLGDTVEINSEFNRVFNRFASEGVGDVVIDLRYNGGGYVSVQRNLANYLINAAGNNNLMMKEQYNDKSTRYNRTTNFKKAGSLNLPRVFFIVSSSTASASELLINNLKPYMDVKLIGPTNTHGKPVGYFPVPVGDWYVFPVSFRTVNKNGEGSYFSGFPVDSKINDGLTKDWGDITESCFASAVKFITGGAFRMQVETFQEQLPQVRSSNIALDAPEFKGSIEMRSLK